MGTLRSEDMPRWVHPKEAPAHPFHSSNGVHVWEDGSCLTVQSAADARRTARAYCYDHDPDARDAMLTLLTTYVESAE